MSFTIDNKMKEKTKVLCVCAKGLNRSKYLAKYLRNKGYKTRFGGVENALGRKSRQPPKLINQEDVDWADLIIIVRKRIVQIFKRKFKTKKRIIIINVTDSKNKIPKEFAHLKEWDYKEFNKKWTYPYLRKSIKPHLPLNKRLK